MEPLEFVALTPIWLRFVFLYVAIGWALSLYEAKRTAGDTVSGAIGGTLLDGVMTPVTAVKLFIASKTTPPAGTPAK